MASFLLSPAQQQYADHVRDLARGELGSKSSDGEHGRVDRALLRRLGDLGLLRGLFGGTPGEAPRDAAAMQLCLLRETLAVKIDLAYEEAFGFAGERCDRIVANVMQRIEGRAT